MDDNRRARVTTLLPVLEGLEVSLHAIWREEERALIIDLLPLSRLRLAAFRATRCTILRRQLRAFGR
jgi:hypothetical protein